MKKFNWTSGSFLMLAGVMFLTFSHVCVKALTGIPPIQVVFFRGFSMLLVTWGVLYLKGINPWGNNKKWLFLRGATGTAALFLFFTTLHKLPLAVAVTIQYLSPVFTALFAVFLFQEKVNPKVWFFYGLAFVGTYFIKASGEGGGLSYDLNTVYILAGVGAAFFAAFAYNCIRVLRNSEHPLVIMFYFSLITSILAAPFALIYWEPLRGVQDLWSIAGVAGGTIIGQFFLTSAFMNGLASQVSLMKYSGALFAFFIGWFYFGEVIPLKQVLGMVIVIFALLMSFFVKKQPAKL